MGLPCVSVRGRKAPRAPRMIPEEIVRFLDHASVGFAASRDAHLTPQVHFVLGWIVGDDRQRVTCLFPKTNSNILIASLENNGEFALTVLGSTAGPKASRPPKPDVDFHECYQLKGTYLSSRPADAEDRGRQETYRAALLASCLEVGYPEALSRPLTQGFAHAPAVAITFRAEEVYQQTPGPDAGTRLA